MARDFRAAVTAGPGTHASVWTIETYLTPPTFEIGAAFSRVLPTFHGGRSILAIGIKGALTLRRSLPLTGERAPSCQRMAIPQAREASEVAVGGDELTAVLDGERSVVCVRDEFAFGARSAAQAREHVPTRRTMRE
jgi:hypothetical protein